MALPEHLKRFTIERALKFGFKLPSQYPLPTAVLRQSMLMSSKLLSVSPHVTVQEATLAGFPAEKVVARGVYNAEKVILHIHGGVFFLGEPRTHRAFASELALKTKATVWSLDYPLSPEHLYPHAMQAVRDAFLALLDQGYQAEDIVLSGDSCGGNLALAAVLALRDAGQPLPAALLLQSPFLDLTLSGESIRMNQNLDPMLNATLLQRGVDYYIGQYTADHPLVSPLFADLCNLPPTLVQVGSKEILLDDSTRFKHLAEKAGSDVTLNIYPGMWHDFQLFVQWIEPAGEAIDEINSFISNLK